jgi:16S rRNA (adenine(1408)-N(1))-methyltransferase
MECLRGKTSTAVDRRSLLALAAGSRSIHLDLGTGDGRYALHLAAACPDAFVIGVDACRENLRRASRRSPNNALFVVANLRSPLPELAGLASSITILFPWGSLLAGLIEGDSCFLRALGSLAAPRCRLECYLNAGALEEQGFGLGAGTERVRASLGEMGFAPVAECALDSVGLRAVPSTWARRLAYGRDPRAVLLTARHSPGYAPSLEVHRGGTACRSG